MPFSPTAKKRHLVEDPYFRRVLPGDPIVHKGSPYLGGAGVHLLTTAVYGVIVGLTEPALRLARMIADELRITADTPVPSDPYDSHRVLFANVRRREALFFSSWLIGATPDECLLSQAIELRIRCHAEYSKVFSGPMDPMTLDELMVLAAAARRYGEGMDLFQRYSTTPLPAVSRVRSERTLAFAICAAATSTVTPIAQLDKAAQRFLHSHIDHWLVHGHAQKVMIWLYILTWLPTGTMSPETVLQTARRYVPPGAA